MAGILASAVERHTISLGSGDTSGTATITVSDTADCVVEVVGVYSTSTSFYPDVGIPEADFLTGPNRVQVTRANSGIAVTVTVEVREYDQTLVESREHSITSGAGTDDITLSPAITLAKSYAVFSTQGDNGSGLAYAELTSTTNLRISAGYGGVAVGTAYVLEDVDGDVWDTEAFGTTATTASGSETISSVDTSTTFLGGCRVAQASSGFSCDEVPQVSLTGTTTVAWARDSTGRDYEIAGWAVELLGSGDSVQRGEMDYGAGSYLTTDTASITAVDLDQSTVQSTAFPSVRADYSGLALRESWADIGFNSATEIQGDVGANTSGAIQCWEVIEYDTGTTAYTLAADGGAVALAGTDAALTADRTVGADGGSVALAGTDAGLAVGRVVVADGGAVALAGTDAALTAARTVAADAGAIAVSGTDAGLVSGRIVAADSGAVAVSGTDAGLTADRSIAADAGAIAVAGTDAALAADRVIAAEAGAVALAGTDAGIAYGRVVTADAGAVILAGQDADLVYSGAGGGSPYTLAADAGAVALAGTDAALVAARTVAADGGSVALSGSDAGLAVGRVVAADAGAIVATGADAGLFAARTITADTGAVVVGGTDTELAHGYRVAADGGAITLSGTDAALVYSRVLVADPGAIVVTGTDAALTYSGVVVPVYPPDATAELPSYSVSAELLSYSVYAALPTYSVTHEIGPR